jgi:hypothetical protein
MKKHRHSIIHKEELLLEKHGHSIIHKEELLLEKHRHSIIHKELLLVMIEEHRMRVCEKRMLRRILGLQREKLRERWRKLNNEELYNLHSLQNIIRTFKARRMR